MQEGQMGDIFTVVATFSAIPYFTYKNHGAPKFKLIPPPKPLPNIPFRSLPVFLILSGYVKFISN
jgi:hypothetical protein